MPEKIVFRCGRARAVSEESDKSFTLGREVEQLCMLERELVPYGKGKMLGEGDGYFRPSPGIFGLDWGARIDLTLMAFTMD